VRGGSTEEAAHLRSLCHEVHESGERDTAEEERKRTSMMNGVAGDWEDVDDGDVAAESDALMEAEAVGDSDGRTLLVADADTDVVVDDVIDVESVRVALRERDCVRDGDLDAELVKE
jgi:hypothetical protein